MLIKDSRAFIAAVFAMQAALTYYWRMKMPESAYSLTFFFSNFGPNATTFVVPAEIFPASLRSTCHGISAASGKVGAMVGAFGFFYAADGIGVMNTLLILGGINFLGMIFTFLIPESKGKSLEEISGEAEEENQVTKLQESRQTVPGFQLN
ncbi:hypothetical protein GH714_021254 [Hevea brasiliensis]|uniref:Major facilitator superfamily (MFS) profile domain-containing protein n=1 Tax=Hevea brasiliensis TaxID=3981 RepID=A0A6A6MPZ5_HEVBR|nr:hypothetical protein GH714_021254 [Hevea brasiliensis]